VFLNGPADGGQFHELGSCPDDANPSVAERVCYRFHKLYCSFALGWAPVDGCKVPNSVQNSAKWSYSAPAATAFLTFRMTLSKRGALEGEKGM